MSGADAFTGPGLWKIAVIAEGVMRRDGRAAEQSSRRTPIAGSRSTPWCARLAKWRRMRVSQWIEEVQWALTSRPNKN